MNKKLATVLAATCVLGATSAFAANPFSDVQPSDWAYQAVEQLADEGIIIGYPDGTFGGERNITRYEMAQLVARAMAHEDMANAEQQAQINRLANEFANELNSLGVRVTNLENRLGNVTIKGDARVRWADEHDNDGFDMRARLNFNAKVADSTSVAARLTTGNFGLDGDNDADLKIDRLYVQHKVGDLGLTGGRYGEKLGVTGYWYDDAVDGAKLAYNNGDFKAVVGYGHLKGLKVGARTLAVAEAAEAAGEAYTASLKAAQKAVDAYNANPTEANEKAKYKALQAAQRAKDARLAPYAAMNEAQDRLAVLDGATHDMEATYAQLAYTGENFSLNGVYIAPNGQYVNADLLDGVWGAGAAFKGESFKLSGDYFSVQGKNSRPDADFWVARVDFGNLSSKQGTWNLFVDYVDAEKYSYLGGSGSLRSTGLLDDVKGWGVGAAFMIADNTKLEAMRTFNSEYQNGNDKDERTVVQIGYKF